MFSVLTALLVVAIIANGLLAGLFFVFACAIVPGFRGVDDATYVRAFRAINRAILNGCFLLVFFTAPLAAVAYASLGTWRTAATSALLMGLGALCSALTFIITVAKNVPLNNRLDRAAVGTGSESRLAREGFESDWNRWNLARSFTSLGALGGLVIAGVLG